MSMKSSPICNSTAQKTAPVRVSTCVGSFGTKI